jgi:hypothetical protein
VRCADVWAHERALFVSLCVRAVKAYYGDTLVGASSSRVEPISDDEDEDDESEERPGEGEVQKHVKMANYYVMTLGVLGPYRRFHSSSKRISDRIRLADGGCARACVRCRKGVGGQLLRHVFDDCHRVEKETAKRAEEKQRRKEARQQDDTKPETDEEDEDEDEDESKVRKRNISISSRAHHVTHTTAPVRARFARCVVSCVHRQCGSARSTSTSPPRADGRWNSTSDTASR